MELSEKQQQILTGTKAMMKIMVQVSKLEKEISTSEKKLEIKKSKMSELLNMLTDQNNLSQNISMQTKTKASSDLFKKN